MKPGWLILFASYALYGLSDAVGPLTYRYGSDVATLALLNCLVPIPALGLTMALTGQSFRIPRDSLLVVALIGVFEALTTFTLNRSYLTVGVGIGTTLHMCHTLVASFGEAALRRRMPGMSVFFGLALAVGGVALISLPGSSGKAALSGILLALFSGFTCGSIMLLADTRAAARTTGFQTPFYSMIVASALLICFNAWTRPGGVLPSLPAPAWGLHIFCGLIVNYGALSLILKGIQRAGATVGSIMGALEPIASVIFGFLLLGERPTLWALAGGALILAGVIAAPLGTRREDAAA